MMTRFSVCDDDGGIDDDESVSDYRNESDGGDASTDAATIASEPVGRSSPEPAFVSQPLFYNLRSSAAQSQSLFQPSDQSLRYLIFQNSPHSTLPSIGIQRHSVHENQSAFPSATSSYQQDGPSPQNLAARASICSLNTPPANTPLHSRQNSVLRDVLSRVV